MHLPTATATRLHDGAPRVAILPAADFLADAAREAGAEIVAVDDAEALLWSSPTAAGQLAATMADNPHLTWVQLPFAGVDPFIDTLDDTRVWTSGKGAYAAPVAEMALALTLATTRHVARYAQARSWGRDHGRMLFGRRVVVLGGGGIAQEYVRLLAPFDCDVTVVRRRARQVPGATVVTLDRLDEVLTGAHVVVVALALTPETTGVLNRRRMDLLSDEPVVVNVARGAHIVTDDLVSALRDGTVVGAGLDVTDPEPLPDGHPLWSMDNVVITPHVGNTEAMGRRLLADRTRVNLARFRDGKPLVGAVDPDAGY